MKKNLMALAVASIALTFSCTGNKTAQEASENDSTNVADRVSAANNELDLATVAGTYEGVLPAADCPGIKTVLTINADSTYQLRQDYIDRKDAHDEASGVLHVLDGRLLMLERPSSGERSYYKVKDDSHLVMTDSLGNEPEGETAKFYILEKK